MAQKPSKHKAFSVQSIDRLNFSALPDRALGVLTESAPPTPPHMPSIAEIIAAKKAEQSAKSPIGAIDVYHHAEAPAPMGSTTIADLIDSIRSDEFAERVAAVRQAVAAGNSKLASDLKKRLQAVSISGAVDGRRKAAVAENRFTHSGFLQIDIDAKDNEGLDLAETRRMLIADKRIVAVFDSPSGNGIKGIARIQPDATLQVQSFEAVEQHFSSLGITIDTACKDPVRLCFVSHDPDAFIDLDRTARFEPLERQLDDAPQLEIRTQHEGLVIRARPSDVTLDVLREMLAVIGRPTYNRWLEICSGAWAHFGEQATPLLQAQWPEERAGEYAEKFANRLTRFSIGTVWHYAAESGWRPSAALRKSLEATQDAKKVTMLCEGFPDPARGNSTPISFAPSDIFFDAPSGKYMVLIDGAYHVFGKRGPIVTGLTRHLAPEYPSTDDLKAAVRAAIDSREVDGAVQWSGAIAGSPQGMARDDGNLPILITSQARLPEPGPHDQCDLIHDILSQAFPDPDQFLVFLAWMKLRYESVRSHKHVPAPMLVVAGEVNSGKSLIGSTIVEKMLGGRSANPYVAWSGGILWNDDLIGSELLLIDDTVASTDIRSRRAFGAAFKEAMYPARVPMRKRNCSTIHIRPVWSVMVCCNNTPEALQIIPPLESDLEDKVILLAIEKIRLPFDTSTPAGRRKLEAAIEADLPAFARVLVDFVVPEQYRDTRSGIIAYRNPQLRDAIEEHSPAKRMLEILETATKDRGTWHDLPCDLTAAEVSSRLLDNHSTVREQARGLLTWHGACGSALAKLAHDRPDIVEQAGVDGHAKVRKYRIKL